MVELLREAGAFAGLAAFLGLAVLALLYFAQARDVRRLRENASFLVEADEASPAAAPPPPVAVEKTAAAVAAGEPEEAAATAAATAPNDREAFRRAELARQAAERRLRFEQRRRGGRRPTIPGRRPGAAGGRPRWVSETPSVVVIVIGSVLLIAGVAFGATRLLGGEDEATTPKGGKAASACAPSTTKVAVLNGTAASGLAAQFAAPLKQNGYKPSPVTNTESPVTASIVMFDQSGRECASTIGSVVGVAQSGPMTAEIRGISEGAPIAVVLGEDVAGGASASAASGASTSASSGETTSSGF
jgi:LytR cell envelope-related transcriptional attenuator